MTLRPADTTPNAIRVLADAVHRERVPGIVEFRLLERALETAAVTPTAENLTLAKAAFDALDHDFRHRIIDHAHRLARDVAEQRRSGVPDPAMAAAIDAVVRPAVPAQTPTADCDPHRHASPLRAALNQGRSR